MAKRRAAKAQPNAELELSCKFNGISIGEGTARVGLNIAREIIKLDAADKYLCGRRLTGTIRVRPAGDSKDQTYLVDGIKHQIRGVFDVKKLSISPKMYSTGLTFSTAEVDVSELAHFAKKDGELLVEACEDLPDGGEDADDADDEEEQEEEDEEQDEEEADDEPPLPEKVRLKRAVAGMGTAQHGLYKGQVFKVAGKINGNPVVKSKAGQQVELLPHQWEEAT